MARTKRFEECEILEKAISLFWTKGYHATSIDDLTKYLGISRSSLYDTFGGKKELFMISLQNYIQKSHQQVFSIVKDTISGIEKIQVLVKNVIESFADGKERKGCFMVNVASELANQDDEIYEFTQKNLEAVKEIFKKIITQGQIDGTISTKNNADNLAYFLFNMYNGLQVSGKMGASQETLWSMWYVAETCF